MSRRRDELFAAPARVALAGALLLPVELLGLGLSGTAPTPAEWLPLGAMLLAVAALGEACALGAVSVLGRRGIVRRDVARPGGGALAPGAGDPSRASAPARGPAAAGSIRGRVVGLAARLHRPLLAWAVFGLADAILTVPPVFDPLLSACSVAGAVMLARALLPAGRLPRPVVAAGFGLALAGLALAPRGLDAFGPQRLLTHARGPYPLAHRALRTAVHWRREQLVRALERERPGEAHRLLANRATLARQFDRLRELVLRARALEAERFGPEGLALADADAALSELIEGSREGDLQDVVARLGLELSLLERTLHELEAAHAERDDGPARGAEGGGAADAAPRATATLTFDTGRGARDVRLPAPGASWLELANVGELPLEQPRLLLDGQGGWPDLDAIVAPLAEGHPTASARAEALWQLLVDRWQHSEPPHSAAELHDPVKLLNVWGYGFCDDVARAYVVLARALGLRARLWALEGHVVPEAFYDGGWHMFDPDGGVHYRDARGEVLSVIALCERPEALDDPVLARGLEHPRYGVQTLRPVYASADDNQLSDVWETGPTHAMGFVLLPGESIRWQRDQGRLRFTDRFFRRPERLANGRWTREQDWVDGADELQLPFRLPYPVLGGRVRVDGPVDAVHVRRPGGPWVELPCLAATDGSAARVAGLEGFLRNGWGDPDYDLVVRLSRGTAADADADADSDAAASEREPLRVSVELVFQHAPDVLPALAAGTHRLELEHAGADTAVRVRLGSGAR